MQSLRYRIVRAYRLHTGAAHARGALAWFARQARVRPGTVTRWLKPRDAGGRRFSGPALGLLETLEAQAPRTTPSVDE